MVYAKDSIEDLDSSTEDHAVDALGYGIEERGPETEIPMKLLPMADQIAWDRAQQGKDW